jgi:hypothetical protein
VNRAALTELLREFDRLGGVVVLDGRGVLIEPTPAGEDLAAELLLQRDDLLTGAGLSCAMCQGPIDCARPARALGDWLAGHAGCLAEARAARERRAVADAKAARQRLMRTRRT